MKIRTMKKCDIPLLVGHGKRMHEESDFKNLDYSEDKCAKLCIEILKNSKYLCVIAEDEGTFYGFFIGYITDYYFGNDWIAEDFLLYVIPNRRGTSAAKWLIGYFEAWATVNGASYTCLGCTTGLNEKKTVGFYERLGYHHKGTLMQKYLL